MRLIPGIKVGAHVEVFHTDPHTGEKHLVHTSRPCAACGRPLDGVIIPKGENQIHAICPGEERRGA